MVVKAGLTECAQINECHFIRVLNIAIFYLKCEDFQQFSIFVIFFYYINCEKKVLNSAGQQFQQYQQNKQSPLTSNH